MAAVFDHADEARAAMRAIVSDPAHGPDALSSPQALANLLQDFLPDGPREAGLLTTAAEKNVAGLLRDHIAQGMDGSTAIRLAAASLADSTAFAPEACAWASMEFAIALGLASADQSGGQGVSGVDTEFVPPASPPPVPQPKTVEAATSPVPASRSADPHTGAWPGAPEPGAGEPGAGEPGAGEPGARELAPAEPSRGRGSRRGALAIAGVALIVFAAAGGYGLSRLIGNTASTALAGTSPSARSASPQSPPSGQRTASSQPASAQAQAQASASPTFTRPSVMPNNIWIAQLASVPLSAGTARRDAVLAEVRTSVPQARVLRSSDYASLNAGFWVVYYAGPFTDGTQVLDYCAAHGLLTPDQCLGRYLSHDVADFGYQCYPPAASPSGTCIHPATQAIRSRRLR